MTSPSLTIGALKGQLAKHDCPELGLENDDDEATLKTRLGGKPATFRCIHGLNEQGEQDLALIRVEIGEVDEMPLRWAIWGDLVKYDSEEQEDVPVAVFQEQVGEQWALLSAHVVSLFGTPEERVQEVVAKTVAHALRLAEWLNGDERSAWINRIELKPGDSFKKVSSPKNQPMLMSKRVAYAALILLGLGATIITENSTQTIAALGVVLLFGALLAETFRRRRADLSHFSPSGLALQERLLSSGLFREITPPKRQQFLGFRAPVAKGTSTGSQWTTVTREDLWADALQHELLIGASLWETNWPAGALRAGMVVPRRWVTIKLVGPENKLNELPDGPRSHRGKEGVTWILTGEELDGGTLDDLLDQTVSTLAKGKTSPYR